MENCTYPYKRILWDLECSVLSGRFAPGDGIPSVRVLAAQYQVNPNTVQRALRELEHKELIISRRCSKTAVTEDTERIRRFRQELAKERTHLFVRKMKELGYSQEQIIARSIYYEKGTERKDCGAEKEEEGNTGGAG